MELREYLKSKDRAVFASQVGTTKNYVNLLSCKLRRPSPQLALRISKATGGAVGVMELLFPDKDQEGQG